MERLTVEAQSRKAALSRGDNPLSGTVRDLIKAGTCFICTEQQPNIATLCCGQAVHFHCISKWFLDPTHDSCPYCRASIQTCPEAQQQEPPRVIVQFIQCQYCSNPAALDCDNEACRRCCFRYSLSSAPCARHGTDGDVSVDFNDDGGDNLAEIYRNIIDDDNAYRYDVSVDDLNTYAQHSIERDEQTRGSNYSQLDDQNDHWIDGIAATGANEVYCIGCYRRPARDCVNGLCKLCCLSSGNLSCERHGTVGTMVCLSCTNRAAQDCSNNYCARCCMSHGASLCDRHGVFYR